MHQQKETVSKRKKTKPAFTFVIGTWIKQAWRVWINLLSRWKLRINNFWKLELLFQIFCLDCISTVHTCRILIVWWHPQTFFKHYFFLLWHVLTENFPSSTKLYSNLILTLKHIHLLCRTHPHFFLFYFNFFFFNMPFGFTGLLQKIFNTKVSNSNMLR